MSFLRQKQAKPNIWLSQMTQLLRHGFLGGTCEQKCLVSHLQVTERGRSCSFHSSLDKTRNSHSECGHGVVWGFLPLRLRTQPELSDDPTDDPLAGEEPHLKSHRTHRCHSGALPWDHSLCLSPSWLAPRRTLQTPGQTVAGSEPYRKYSRPHFHMRAEHTRF